MVYTLTALGVLENGDNGFSFGTKFYVLGKVANQGSELIHTVHPFLENISQKREKRRKDQEYDTNDFILLFEVSHGTLAYIGRDFDHTFRPLTLLHHFPIEKPCKHES